MKSIAALAVLLAACAAASAQSQEVYRCGNSYSQKPCAGGAAVQVDDSRSVTQNKASIEQTQRDAKTAEEMQKARLKEEAKASPALIVGASTPQPEERTAKRPTMNKPEFTATEPRKKKEPTQKKKASGEKKATKKSAAKETKN